MNLPTSHQIAVFGTHAAAAAASAVAVIGFTHVATPDQVKDATTALGQISDGVALIMKGGGTLVGFGVTIYATVKSGPFASLLRAVTSIAQDPNKLQQIRQGDMGATLTEKAALVTVTDGMPEVAGVGTTLTQEGKALAKAVPSSSVQPVNSVVEPISSVSTIAKAV